MIEILPIKLLTDEESWIFGSLNVALGKLSRYHLPVASGIIITAPNLKLQTTLEHFDFKTKEVFEQSLTLFKNEIKKIPVPQVLQDEAGKHSFFLVNDKKIKSIKELWLQLLLIWIDEIKNRIWKEGFYKGVTVGLEPQAVIFVKKITSYGRAFFDSLQEDSVINISLGKLHPNDLKKIDEIVREANKKLFIPHEYEWIVDGGVKLTKVLPYTPNPVILNGVKDIKLYSSAKPQNDKLSAVKVFLDLSTGLSIEKEDVDGIYIASERIFDLNKPQDSFENLVLKLVDSATTFDPSPVLFKLADKSEGMGKVRGTLRLLHQKSLFDPLIEALDFIRHKKSLTNVHIVIPFVRNVSEFLKIKRELAVKKLMRKNSLQLWLEIAVPENLVNLEDYLVVGLDGVVLNLDELIAHLNGFDPKEQELSFYKNEVDGLLKFLEDGLKLIHKSKIPFIAYGNLVLNPKVLDFLVEKGVYGVVVEKYEAPSIRDLLYQAERKMILQKNS